MTNMAYVGRCKCGQVVGAVVDNDRRDVADTVAEFIRDGLSIERVTVEQARKMFGSCECEG